MVSMIPRRNFAAAVAIGTPKAVRRSAPKLTTPSTVHRAVELAEAAPPPPPADRREVWDEPGGDYADWSFEQRERARRDVQQRLAAFLDHGRPRVVVTDNRHTMVSVKRGQGVVTFRVHHMFLNAPSIVLRALGRYASSQERESERLVRAFIDANDQSIRKPSCQRPVAVDVEGKHHNLQEIFDELNERYFGGQIRAQITWGARHRRIRGRSSIKLGSYTFEDELIRIHPVLDAADVPQFFVAWIVYHEMLHEVHDMPVVDGRRVYHTPEFRRAEARFEAYAEAVLWERINLHKLLDR